MHGGWEDVFSMNRAWKYHEILVLFVVVCCMYRENKYYEVSAAWTEAGGVGGLGGRVSEFDWSLKFLGV